MYATDFEFDSLRLSDFGLMIADINGEAGFASINAGVPLNVKTVSRNKGKRFSLTDVSYESALEITFQVCRTACMEDGDFIINDQDYMDIVRWLKRSERKEISFIHEDYASPRLFNGIFNINRLEYNHELIGLELTFITDRPYAYGETVVKKISMVPGESYEIIDQSHIEGWFYPDLEIKCKSSGTLMLSNETFVSNMIIKNCTTAEVITVDGENKIISTTLNAHKLWGDFNYEFLRVGNKFNNRKNYITTTLPCDITLSYKPVVIDAF